MVSRPEVLLNSTIWMINALIHFVFIRGVVSINGVIDGSIAGIALSLSFWCYGRGVSACIIISRGISYVSILLFSWASDVFCLSLILAALGALLFT